eukprot:6492225-Amphidinium_carterae.2
MCHTITALWLWRYLRGRHKRFRAIRVAAVAVYSSNHKVDANLLIAFELAKNLLPRSSMESVPSMDSML